MIELTLTIIALAAIGFIVWSKEAARKSYDIMVPRCTQKDAQHAADASQKSQVVVFDVSTFDIMKADNQHAARGEIVMVVHPKQLPNYRNIKVCECLKPNSNVIAEVK